MKICSKCNREYSDETLNFCLDDGTPLNFGSVSQTNESIPRPTEQDTAILTNKNVPIIQSEITHEDIHQEQETIIRNRSETTNASQPVPVRQGVSPFFAYMTVGLLALLVFISGIVLAVWLSSNSFVTKYSNAEIAKGDSNKIVADSNANVYQEDSAQNTTASKENDTDQKENIETPKRTPKPVPEKTAKVKETPKPNITPKPTGTPKPTETPKPVDGKWFVILGSFPQSQSARARQRLQLARSKGLSARLINTNNYPGLRNGLVAVVMGPFSKSKAQAVLRRARTVSRDAYIKEG